ncbi:MAG TPA: type II toxin-antitoxin system VapC family toxin [Stellaceae bacterium]|jgi:predicted nucleic acid-binding protein|nr:type II toxin-antitoxin system VapC family toxin [Stellaceae bacterium]
MALVADASIVLAWAFEEAFPDAEATLRRIRNEQIVVPTLWWFEIRNVLVLKEGFGRWTPDRTALFLSVLAQLAIRLDGAPQEAAVLDLARRHHLTVYDAAYLELAIRERLPLATLDRALREAARAEAISVIASNRP